MSYASPDGHAHFQPQTKPTSPQQLPPSYHTTSLATDLPRPQKRGQNFSETSRCRDRAHSPHSSATEAPQPEWPPGGQTSSPIPTLLDHGPKNLTLATVRVSSYPKPYGPPQPYQRARVTTPNPSDGSGRGMETSEVTPDVGGTVLTDTPTQESTTHTQHLLRTRENLNEIHNYSTIAHSHTRTQRPKMTSGRVIKPLFLFYLSKVFY